MNDLGKNILEKIKENHLKPKPRWEFLLKNYVMWAIFIIAILIGSQATGVIIFMAKHTDWQYHSAINGPAKEIMINLPYFWLIILATFAAVAYYNLKHTKKGYRYNPFVVFGASIIISIVLGLGIYTFGGGENLEEIFYQRFPFYREMMRYQGKMMINPNDGRIAGVVIGVKDNLVIIEDFNGKIWEIVTSTPSFVPGQRVNIIGRMLPGQQFETYMIKPWFKPRHQPPRPCEFNHGCPLP